MHSAASAPASSLEMGEAEFAFQFLVVALDAPAQFGRVDKNLDGRVFGQGRRHAYVIFVVVSAVMSKLLCV